MGIGFPNSNNTGTTSILRAPGVVTTFSAQGGGFSLNNQVAQQAPAGGGGQAGQTSPTTADTGAATAAPSLNGFTNQPAFNPLMPPMAQLAGMNTTGSPTLTPFMNPANAPTFGPYATLGATPGFAPGGFRPNFFPNATTAFGASGMPNLNPGFGLGSAAGTAFSSGLGNQSNSFNPMAIFNGVTALQAGGISSAGDAASAHNMFAPTAPQPTMNSLISNMLEMVFSVFSLLAANPLRQNDTAQQIQTNNRSTTRDSDNNPVHQTGQRLRQRLNNGFDQVFGNHNTETEPQQGQTTERPTNRTQLFDIIDRIISNAFNDNEPIQTLPAPELTATERPVARPPVVQPETTPQAETTIGERIGDAVATTKIALDGGNIHGLLDGLFDGIVSDVVGTELSDRIKGFVSPFIDRIGSALDLF